MDTREILTLAIAAAGWVYAGFKDLLSYRERQATRKEDRLFAALAWFTGKTQRRSVGIAVVEGLWKDFPAHHKTLLPLLANQAVYLLAESDSASAHERSNLERLMRLILSCPSFRADFADLHHELAQLTSSSGTRGPTGKIIEPVLMGKWHTSLLAQSAGESPKG